jgi:hypothetical protein
LKGRIERGMNKGKTKLLDPQIREALFADLEATDPKIRIMEEMKIGSSRADFLLVTDGIITGYEIKSDADSYARLQSQTRDYGKFCDYCYVVVGKSHQKGIFKYVPDFWGVIVITAEDGNIKIEELREASISPNVTLYNKMRLLWKRELVNIRAKYGMPKHINKKKFFLSKEIERKIPKDDLALAITDELFERDYTIFK